MGCSGASWSMIPSSICICMLGAKARNGSGWGTVSIDCQRCKAPKTIAKAVTVGDKMRLSGYEQSCGLTPLSSGFARLC